MRLLRRRDWRGSPGERRKIAAGLKLWLSKARNIAQLTYEYRRFFDEIRRPG
jgi:hypothetical protein